MKLGGIKPEHVLDIKHIPELDGLSYTPEQGLRIGALVKLFDIQTSELVHQVNPSVAQSAKYIASTQVRHKGTLMGNICAAVPSCDGGPILLAQNAVIHAVRYDGETFIERDIPADAFFTGVKKTCLAYDEIATHITIPPLGKSDHAAYIKFAVRKAMDLAIVGVAAWLRMRENICMDCRIALGAVAPTPILVPEAAKVLIGREITENALEACGQAAMNACRPISDVRASAEYRSDMVRVFTKRAVRKALAGYEGDHI